MINNIVPIMIIGALSSLVSHTIFYPVHVLKSKVIMNSKKNTGVTTLSIIKNITKLEGIRG
jgi:hypothetical protein